MEIAAGAHHFAHHLTLDRQRALAGHCRSLVNGAVPAYVPIVRAIDTNVCILNYYDAEGRMGACIKTRTKAPPRSRPTCPWYPSRSATPPASSSAA